MQPRTRITRILVASVRAGGPDRAAAVLAAGASLPGLVGAARFHGVAPWVHEALREAPAIEPGVAAELEVASRIALRDHLAVIANLADVARALDPANVSWMVVKGPVLAHTVYTRPDLRDYLDLDLVVPGDQLGRALDAFDLCGYRPLVADWRTLRDLGAGEVPVLMRHDVVADVHWHLLNVRRVRSAYDISMEDLFTRSRAVDVAGHTVRTLDSADTLLHLALHAAKSGGNRLLWLKDMEQAVGGRDLDWDEVVRRARATGLALITATMLRRARQVLGADVPPEVERALDPDRVWSGVVSAAEWMAPPAAATGAGSVLRLVTRATRADARSSVRELVSASVKYAQGRPPTDDVTGGDPSPDPTPHPNGDRAEFLREIAVISADRSPRKTS